MTRSLSILARKNKEAQQFGGGGGGGGGEMLFQCMDDASILSYDMTVAQSRRNLLAADRLETAPLPAASAHTPSKSLFQGVASIARKVSSRISFRDGHSNNNNNDRNELAAAAAALQRVKVVSQEHDGTQSDDDDEDDDDRQLAHHLTINERRQRLVLSPPSIIADDMTVASHLNKDDLKQHRSQSLPRAKRRSGRKPSPAAAASGNAQPPTTPAAAPRRTSSLPRRRGSNRSSNDDSERRPSSGSKNSSGESSDSNGRSKLRRKSQTRQTREHEEQLQEQQQLPPSSSKPDHHDGDEDHEAISREPVKKTRRKVLVKVRSTKVDADSCDATDSRQLAANEELIRDALKNASSRKLDHLLHLKLSSNTRTHRRGSNGAQSCVEPQTTSRESFMAFHSPATTKHSARVKLSPARSPISSSLPLSRTCMDTPERVSAASRHHDEIDAPTGVLHQSLHHSPSHLLRRSRSKSRSEKEVSRSSSEPKNKEKRASARRTNDSPTQSPMMSDSPRSPSSPRKSESPKDARSRKSHRRKSSKLEEIKSLLLDVEDDACRKDSTTRGKSASPPTPDDQRADIRRSGISKSTHSPRTTFKHTEHKEYSVRSRGGPASKQLKNGGLVEGLKQEMSEANKKNREQLTKSKHVERASSHTPRSRPRRVLDLDNTFPAPDKRLSSGDVSVTESVGTASGTPRLRRKRASARSPAHDKVTRSTAIQTTSLNRVDKNVSSDSPKKPLISRRRVNESIVPELPNLRIDGSNNKHSKVDDSQLRDTSAASETSTADMDLHLGDFDFGTKIDYEMDDYADEDIITLKPAGNKAKPVVAAQLQLPGLSPSNIHGDEVSVHYEDVVAYNSDNNTF